MRPDLAKITDQARMTAWGELSEDRNPLHVDPGYAANTRYGGTIAHGHMLVAWITEWLAGGESPITLSGTVLSSLRFRAPVHPGHRYVVRSTHAGVEMLDEEGNSVLTAELRKGAQEDGHGKSA
jgi:3-hydroxybutyryl-CoA dehydratase